MTDAVTDPGADRSAHGGRPAEREADDLVEELLDALPDWFAVVGRVSELIAERLDISPTDLQCLHFLNQHGPASPSELARRVGRTTGAVTRMIDRLERAGFVERHRRADDRRGVQVASTEAGIARIAAYFDDIAATSRADLARRSDHELAVLAEFIRTSTANSTRQMRHLMGDASD